MFDAACCKVLVLNTSRALLLFSFSMTLSILNDLESLRSEFKRMELPKSREEFESRAQLLQFLNDMEDFLVIKRNFFKTTNNH